MEFSSDAQAVLIGVILGAVLTKLSEFIQITNRRERRASHPRYIPRSSYNIGSNASIHPNDPNSDCWYDEFRFDQLEKSGAREIILISSLNTKLSKILTGMSPYYIDIYVKDEKKYFLFKVKYFLNGFKYKDYWIGTLVDRGTMNSPSYQIKFIQIELLRYLWLYFKGIF